MAMSCLHNVPASLPFTGTLWTPSKLWSMEQPSHNSAYLCHALRSVCNFSPIWEQYDWPQEPWHTWAFNTGYRDWWKLLAVACLSSGFFCKSIAQPFFVFLFFFFVLFSFGLVWFFGVVLVLVFSVFFKLSSQEENSKHDTMSCGEGDIWYHFHIFSTDKVLVSLLMQDTD